MRESGRGREREMLVVFAHVSGKEGRIKVGENFAAIVAHLLI